MSFISKITSFRLRQASSIGESPSDGKLMRKAQAIKIASDTLATIAAGSSEAVLAVAGATAVAKYDGQVVKRLSDYSSESDTASPLSELGALAEISPSQVESTSLVVSDAYDSDSSEYSLVSSDYNYSSNDSSDNEASKLKAKKS